MIVFRVGQERGSEKGREEGKISLGKRGATKKPGPRKGPCTLPYYYLYSTEYIVSLLYYIYHD